MSAAMVGGQALLSPLACYMAQCELLHLFPSCFLLLGQVSNLIPKARSHAFCSGFWTLGYSFDHGLEPVRSLTLGYFSHTLSSPQPLQYPFWYIPNSAEISSAWSCVVLCLHRWFTKVAKSVAVETILTGLKSPFCCLLAVWLWDLLKLCLQFLISKMGIIIGC